MNQPTEVKNEVSQLMGVKDATTEGKKETLSKEEQKLEVEGGVDSTIDAGVADGEETQAEVKTDEEVGDAPDTTDEDKESEVPEGNLDKLKQENEELRALLEDTLGSKEPKEEVGSKQPAPALTKLEPKTQSYAKLEDIEQITAGDSGGVTTLNMLLNTVRQDAVNMVIEHIAASIPDLVTREATRVVATQEAINEFYRINTDLRKFKQFTSFVYEGLIGQHPGKYLVDFLEGSEAAVKDDYDLATEVRKRLKMRGDKGVQVASRKSEVRPQATGTNASSKRGIHEKLPAPKGVQSEVEALKQKFGTR